MSAQTSKQQPTAGVPEEWADDHLATIFTRWHPFMSRADLQSQDLVIAEAGIQPGDTVLDVACGAGIPALRAAERVGPDGRVVATDPSPVFLAATAENAARQGLTNLDTVQASAATLPFRPGSFDAATCHFGVMFFTDITAGLTRIRETLKPGKRAAFIAWGPDADNQLFSSFGAVVGQYAPPPPPPDPRSPRSTSRSRTGLPRPGRFPPPCDPPGIRTSGNGMSRSTTPGRAMRQRCSSSGSNSPASRKESRPSGGRPSSRICLRRSGAMLKGKPFTSNVWSLSHPAPRD